MTHQSKKYIDSKIEVDSWEGMERALNNYPDYSWRDYVMSHRDSLKPNRFQIIRLVNNKENTRPEVYLRYSGVVFVSSAVIFFALLVFFVWHFFFR